MKRYILPYGVMLMVALVLMYMAACAPARGETNGYETNIGLSISRVIDDSLGIACYREYNHGAISCVKFK